MWVELINFNLAQLDLQQLSEMLGKSVRVKESIVQEDPHLQKPKCFAVCLPPARRLSAICNRDLRRQAPRSV